MLKVYVHGNGFKMIGKAKDIIRKLREYEHDYDSVANLLLNNQQAASKSPYAFSYDRQTFTLITAKKTVPKIRNYYLLFPNKNRNTNL